MSTPRPATLKSPSSRPLSAIFLGNLDANREPTSTERSQQLPSPPHTNSNDGGSTGDSGTVGRKGLSLRGRPVPDMDTRDRRNTRPTSRSTYHDDEDDRDDVHDLPNEYNEDHTARMSDDRRSIGTGSSGSAVSRSSANSNGALTRARTLADRNRRVLDKLAAITTTSSRTTTRSMSVSRRHMPFTNETLAQTPSSPKDGLSPSPSHVSFTHSLSDKGLVSGSDTERERLSSDDHSMSPPSNTYRLSEGRGSVRRHVSLVSFSSPSLETHSSTIRQPLDFQGDYSSSSVKSRPSPSRTREEKDERFASGYNTSRNRRNSRRAPLPFEFRDGNSHSQSETVSCAMPFDTRSTDMWSKDFDSTSGSLSPETSKSDRNLNLAFTPSRKTSDSAINVLHDLSSDVVRTDRNTRRFATVREPGSRTHGRYASDASSTDMSIRQRRRGGSAENAIIPPSGRSLIGETLKSAGLSPRKERRGMPTFSPNRASRASMPNGTPGAATLRDAFRSSSREGSHEQERITRSNLDRTSTFRPPASSRAGNTPETISRPSFEFSRPSTSVGLYGRDDHTYAGSPLQRGPSVRASPVNRDNGRDLSSPPRPLLSSRPLATPSPSLARTRDHPDILIDALSMLEGHLSRLPSSSSVRTTDCLRSAQTLVDASRTLNAKLRNATNSAIEQHVEAEIEGSALDGELLAAELWKNVGTEFRENLRMSDELIRSLTVFLLTFGKLLRDNNHNQNRPASVGSNEDISRLSRLSLESVRRYPDMDSRDSVEQVRRNEGSRGSDSGRHSLDSRLSLETPVREPGFSTDVRPSTSMSQTRTESIQRPGIASPDLSRSRKPGMFSVLSSSSKRLFTSRRSSQSSSVANPSFSAESDSYDSPTPARHADPARVSNKRGSADWTTERPVSTLPPISLLHRPSDHRLRKNKTSTTSNATVRGASILPSASTALPAQVTITATANSPEEFQQRSRSMSNASPPSLGDEYNDQPHYVEREHSPRKRTISSTSDSFEDSPVSPVLGTISHVDVRGLRPRQSLGSPPTIGWDRGRRRTITGLFN